MSRPERPVDPDAGVVQRFAVELRRLRHRAGSPGYRELAKVAHYSPTTLAQAARGEKLPSLAVTLAYARACGGDPAEWEARWRAAAEELEPSTSDRPAGDPTPSPYLGLAAFGTENADRFFGRDRMVARLVDLLCTRRLVVLTGPSGSGTSSLLLAGLVPALRAQDAWRTLVVDQFEEVFAPGRDPAERDRFIAALLDAARDPDEQTRVVLGLRADFAPCAARHPLLGTVIADALVRLEPMSTEELRAAITRPAARAGCRVETGLVAQLVADATAAPGALPWLSHTLSEAWRHRRGNTVTLAAYQAAGGIPGAVTRAAERTYAALDAGQRRRARQLLLRLAGADGAGRCIQRDELDSGPETDALLDRLAGARLVTLGPNSVELAHDALVRCWPRLRTWLAEDRDGVRIHRELTDATNAWEALDRDPGSLYRGARLTVARNWAAGNDSVLARRERDFLDASLVAQAREQAAGGRLDQLVALLMVLLVAAMVVMISVGTG